ncbi:autophagy-related protein 13-like [Mercenaria mercenaria]|uniref:autophagy-related protein 13-like n=1 Tax=Mercenaria mercenaria TaxID=6596 RepID=UPI00234F664C|nr:autophagy-related protein 13-like [Mercenaria mercenaria]
MTAKSNAQDRKDFDKFTKFFVYKSIQIIVQSRLGEKIKTKSKPFSSGADWFNIAITDNNEVHTEAKKVVSNQTTTLAQNVCVEISLRTAEGDTMVLELWYINLDTNQYDISAKMSQTGYSRMSIALKSLLNVSRVTPAYRLSRRQGSSDYIICYRIYLGEPQFYILGESYQKSKVGSVPTPYGTIGIHLGYRTKLLLSPQNTTKEVPFEVKDDHFKQDNSPVRPTTPKPCSSGYRRQSTCDSDTGQSEESCTTTFSTSPCGESLRTKGSPASHHQSQPIKINLQGSSPVTDKFPDDLRPQSAPEKPFTYQDCHRVGAFVQHFTDNKHSDTDDVPFLSLLQQVKLDRQDKEKTDNTKLEASKGTSSTKTESSRDTSESALSESKTSTSSQISAPDDFVMVELKTPFAGADANSDLGKFYRECQSAPALTICDEEQSVPEALEQLTTQLESFETNMKDFDNFVSELNIENESIGFEPKADKVFET